MTNTIEAKLKSRAVELPRVPNFLKVGDEIRPVSDFDEESLQAIGVEWTKRLIERSKNQNPEEKT